MAQPAEGLRSPTRNADIVGDAGAPGPIGDGTTSSFARGLRLLDHLARSGRPMGVTELARAFGVAKSNIHRLLGALVDEGFAVRRADGRYVAGLRLWELGLAVYSTQGLARLARPALTELMRASEETVHLSVLDGAEVLYVDKIDSPQPVGAYSHLGGRAPAHCVATGKALLAHAEPDQIDAIIARGIARYAPLTITDSDALKDHLRQIRRAGLSINRGEWRADVTGLAAPVRDATGQVIAAVGISGPAQRLNEARMKALAGAVRAAAARIEAALAGREARV